MRDVLSDERVANVALTVREILWCEESYKYMIIL